MGITSQLLDIQQSQGSRSHVIGAYRIVVHRVQKQLSSFLDVDGFWPQNEDSVEKKDLKKPNPKAEKKILAGNLISKENPKEDFFLSCWRTKASEEESYETESKNETTHARENREKQSHAKTEFVEKTKLDVWRKSPKSQSRKARGEENSTSSTPRSTTCTVL